MKGIKLFWGYLGTDYKAQEQDQEIDPKLAKKLQKQEMQKVKYMKAKRN